MEVARTIWPNGGYQLITRAGRRKASGVAQGAHGLALVPVLEETDEV